MAKRVLLTISWLSIDVVAGALACGAMVAYLLKVEMPTIWWVALPLAVWVMYTADHLLDARRLGKEAHTPRHLFHFTYFRPIFICWLIGFISCISWIFWFCSYEFKLLGIGVGLLALGHFALIKIIGNRVSLLLHKELGVGVIYTIGIWGGGMILKEGGLTWQVWALAFQFFMLTLVNLLIFSAYEIEEDEKDGHTSFARALGTRKVKKFITALICLNALVGLGVWMHMDSSRTGLVCLTQLAILTVHALLLFLPKYFKVQSTYRYLGDGAFMLPIWLLLIEYP